MNCLQFRQGYLTDPFHQTAESREHRNQCQSCAAFAVEQDRINAAVERTIRVTPSENLEARILVRQSFLASRVEQRRASMMWAVAAAIVLGIAISVWVILRPAPGTLADAVVSYVRTQPVQTLSLDAMPPEQVQAVLQGERIRFQPDVIPVYHAKPCVINGTRAIYMVVASDSGPVSVVVMPQQTVPDRATFAKAGYQGVIVRCPQGSMAVIGTSSQKVEKVEKRMLAAMRSL
jgi:hypothetical protein